MVQLRAAELAIGRSRLHRDDARRGSQRAFDAQTQVRSPTPPRAWSWLAQGARRPVRRDDAARSKKRSRLVQTDHAMP